MIKAKGLGRGLDALLGGGRVSGPVAEGILREIPVGDLVPGKYQPRTRMDKSALEELAQSINQDPRHRPADSGAANCPRTI